MQELIAKINTNGACVYVNEDINCKGKWEQISPFTTSHDNLADIGFNDKISSVEFCSNYESTYELFGRPILNLYILLNTLLHAFNILLLIIKIKL